jgi:2-polyprenyl-3-methyl-5-hydroxy-6-metoxy-1,4-benzoquinol methylase
LSEQERLQWLEDMEYELEWLRSLDPTSIVDVGCGPGWLLRAMLDIWKIGVETCEGATAEVWRHGITCVGSTDDLPAGSFDVVVCYHVIEHMRDPERELCQMRKLLRKGGWLLLGTPDFHSPCAVRFGDNYRMLHDPTHISLFTLESMHRFLRDYGFTVHDVRFPFPDRYATAETFARWNDTSQVSPPWPGNWMTFYAQR